jgi:hypothetical protein
MIERSAVSDAFNKGPIVESIKHLDGDDFGNDSIHLWRCLFYEGRFIAPDVESFVHIRVGMISMPNGIFDELATKPPSE